MNFEIKALDLTAAAAEKCDLLVVLIPKDFKPGKEAVSQLIGGALKSGDLETGVGKCLALYRPGQAAAVRVVFPCLSLAMATILSLARLLRSRTKAW